MWELLAKLFLWLGGKLDKNPYQIHNGTTLYMRRYRLIRWGFLRFYVHHIFRSDADRDWHDHPWAFWSLILRGGYLEYTPSEGCGWDPDFSNDRRYSPGSLIRHKATDLHRLQLLPELDPLTNRYELERPAVTLVWAGKKTRDWGFQTPQGWVQWQEYIKAKETPRAETDSHDRVG